MERKAYLQFKENRSKYTVFIQKNFPNSSDEDQQSSLQIGKDVVIAMRDLINLLVDEVEQNYMECDSTAFKRYYDLLMVRLHDEKEWLEGFVLDRTFKEKWYYFGLEYVNDIYGGKELNYHEINLAYYSSINSLINTSKAAVPLISNDQNNDYSIDSDLQYGDLDELFINTDIADKCYQVLIEIGALDEELRYLQGNKGVFCIWATEIRRARLNRKAFASHVTNKQITELMEKKFQGFKMSPRMFDQEMPRAKQLEPRIQTLLAGIR